MKGLEAAVGSQKLVLLSQSLLPRPPDYLHEKRKLKQKRVQGCLAQELAATVVIILPFAGWLQLITCPQMWGNVNLEFVNSSVVFWQEGGFWQTVSGNKLSLQGSEPCCNCWRVFMPCHPFFREAAVQPAAGLWNRSIAQQEGKSPSTWQTELLNIFLLWEVLGIGSSHVL